LRWFLNNYAGGIEQEVYWFHPDHLGSSSYITGADGEVTQNIEYFPSGETFIENHKNSNYSPYKFNGKELDAETGYYYYGARYYNPRVSLWLNVDPLADYNPFYNDQAYIDGEHNGGIYNSFNNNPYIYCYQNSVILVDPDGKQTLPQLFDDAIESVHESKLGRYLYRAGNSVPDEDYKQAMYFTPYVYMALTSDVIDAYNKKDARPLLEMAVVSFGRAGGKGAPEGSVRRPKSEGDITFSTSRAARRAAMRSKNIPTSQTYQTKVEKLPKVDQNSAEFKMYKEKIFRKGKEVGEVSLHKEGHLFKDAKPKSEYEPPHYHDQKGAHFTYKKGNPRSTNMTGKQH